MMRVWISSVAVACFASASCACAQTSPDTFSGEVHATSEISSTASIAATLSHTVSGQPYEAHKATATVWRLADGTTIRHDADSQIARDGEGRVREEVQMTHASSMGGKQMNRTTSSVTIGDPVDHSITLWTGASPRIAMHMTMPQMPKLMHPAGIMGGVIGGPPPPPVRLGTTNPHTVGTFQAGKPAHVGNEVRTEDLGKQSIGGVMATGKRTTTVIPMGEVGNDRPITVVHEEWQAPDLQITVKSFDSDPRSGERTMELSGVTRGEPAAALFHAPEGVKVVELNDASKLMSGIASPAGSK